MVTEVIRNFFKTCKRVINAPREHFSAIANDNKAKPHLIFLAILWFIGSILSAIGTIIFGYLIPLSQGRTSGDIFPQVLSTQLIGILPSTVLGIVIAFIGTAVMHLWIKVFRGKGKIVKTFQLNVYTMVPSILFGWVPFANLIASFYGIYLTILGLESLHKMTRKRAVLTVIALYVFVFIVGLLFSSAIPRSG